MTLDKQEEKTGEKKEVQYRNLDSTLCNVPLETDFQLWLSQLCEEKGIDYSLMIAIAEKESNFNPEAVSSTGDYGLWQINKINHKELKEVYGDNMDFFNPYDNARAAVWILCQLMEKYGDINKVLMAYNMGEAGAGRLWEQGIYKSEYSDDVQAKAYWYKNNFFIAKTGSSQ